MGMSSVIARLGVFAPSGLCRAELPSRRPNCADGAAWTKAAALATEKTGGKAWAYRVDRRIVFGGFLPDGITMLHLKIKGGAPGLDWQKIIGPIGTRDPHMIESVAPRTDKGVKKFAGDRAIDPVNGDESPF